MIYTESSITLNFPDKNCFRFEDCEAYKLLSGHSFKEMDACWYDEINNELYLVELKDWVKTDLSLTESSSSKI